MNHNYIFKVKILVSLMVGLMTFGLSAQAAHLDCLSTEGLKIDSDEVIKFTAEIDENDLLTNINLSLLDANSSPHSLVQTTGPVAADPKFHPTSQRLQGFQKFVLEKHLDSFLFFWPVDEHPGRNTAYVKLAFDGTRPDLEKLTCNLREK